MHWKHLAAWLLWLWDTGVGLMPLGGFAPLYWGSRGTACKMPFWKCEAPEGGPSWQRSHTCSVSSVAQSCPPLCDPMNHSTPGLPIHHQCLETTQTHVHWVGDAIQPSHPLSSPSSPALNPSQHQVFSNESALSISWPKYWSFSFNISPSNGHPGLISFRMDWLDLLAESSPTPQFKSINSLALRFLYSPTLTSIHDHWKNHSLD